MSGKGKLALGLAWIILLCPLAFAQNHPPERSLAKKYVDWLNLVTYCITDQELEVFSKLTDDRDRDIFIDTFWKMRDPTPGTPENEYKEELIKRFEYVNKYFSRGTTRPGWQTDMGKVYMILGPPASTETFEGAIGLLPCQAWTYYGDTKKDLPSNFVLLFYKKHGVGEFRLYDPVSDGPYELLENKRDFTPDDYEGIYERIYNLAPTLADLTISIIPGEYSPLGPVPSPRNTIILHKILESAKREINTSYATHFLNYKGYVSTEYLTNYVESDSLVEIIPDPATGLLFVHFTIAPKSVSVDFYVPKNQYYCNYRLDVSLRQKDKIIFQYNRVWPIYFPEESVNMVKANGLAFEDSFPAAEGQYQLVVLLQNTVGKEFCLLEQELTVQPLPVHPCLEGPYLGYKLEKFSLDSHIPFKIGENKLVVDPRQTLAPSDSLAIMFQVANLTRELHQSARVIISIKGITDNNKSGTKVELPLNQQAFSRLIPFDTVLPAADLLPDYYELELSLVDDKGQILDRKKNNFVVTTQKVMGHPIAKSKALPLSRQYVFFYTLASQYAKIGNGDRAEYFYQLGFSANPNFKEGLVDYITYLLAKGSYEKVLEIASILKNEASSQFEYHLFMGQAWLGKGDYRLAVNELSQANSIYNSNIAVLNALGLAHYKLGEKDQALAALSASLKLNPDQPSIKELVDMIKGNRPDN